MSRMHHSLGVVATVVSSLACSAQMEPGYSGEPSATIHGTLSTGTKEAPRDVEVAAIFLQQLDGPVQPETQIAEIWTSAQVGIDIQFPAEFKLKLYDPPDSQVMNTDFLRPRLPV